MLTTILTNCIHIHIGCICSTFLRWAFLNISSNGLHEKSNLAFKGVCDFDSSQADNLRTHLKCQMSNKYNQCDYASSHAGHLSQHLKHTVHCSGEKLNKLHQTFKLLSFGRMAIGETTGSKGRGSIQAKVDKKLNTSKCR